MQNNKELAIKQLVLDFESMESLTIPSEHLHGCEFTGITETWSAGPDGGNVLSKVKRCESCHIFILHGMETENSWYHEYMEDFEEANTNLFQRLQHDDLTSVKIYLEDGSWEEIIVPWSDEDIPVPSIANNWQRISYNKEEEYILLRVEKDLTDEDLYWWEK